MKTNTITKPGPRRTCRLAALLMVLALTMVPVLALTQTAYAAEDLSEYLSVESVQLFFDDDQGGKTNLDHNGNGTDPNTYSNGVNQQRMGFTFNWNLDLGTSGLTISEGDTVSIPIRSSDPSATSMRFTLANCAPDTLYDEQGNDIGTWRVSASSTTGTIVLTFNSEAAGHTSYTGSCSTSPVFNVVGSTEQDQIRQATIGDKTVTYKKLSNTLTPMTTTAVGRKASVSTTNSRTTWLISTGTYAETYSTSSQYEPQRQDPSFAQNTIIKKDVFFEDEFDSAAHVSTNNVAIISRIYYPMGEGDGSASRSSWLDSNIKAAFTQLVPNAGESKDAFRARIKSQELQYGFYEEDGKTIFMAYLGNFPNDNLKWVDPQGRWDTEVEIDNAAASGAYPDASQERADLWKAAHAANNLINGDITEVQFRLSAQYPTVIKETAEKNTVTVEYDGVAESRTGTATFRPNTAVATPAHDAVTLVKFDEDTNSVLEGATFKLQRKDAQGQWQDYTPQTGATTAATNDSGTVSFSGLVNGEYRFVETAAASGYDASTLKIYSDAGETEITDEVHFTINAGNAAGPILYASNKKGVEAKYGSLSVSKTVAGNAADATKAFNFTVTLKDADGAALAETEVGDTTTDENGKITFALKGGESKTITSIPEGTTYEVAETEANQDGYTTTSEGVTGTIAADATATASFTNTKNYTPVKVDPPVTKVVEGTEDKDAFTYTLTAVSGPNNMAAADMSMPEGAESGSLSITKEGVGSYVFGEFELAVPGTYVYQITEEAGSLDYEYDDSTYTVTYVVAAGADGKTLVAEPTITKDGEAADAVVFTNVKKADTTDDGDNNPGNDPNSEPEPSDPDKTPDKTPVPQKNTPSKGTTTTPANATPQTGDTTNPALWLTLLALSGAALAGAYRLRRKEER